MPHKFVLLKSSRESQQFAPFVWKPGNVSGKFPRAIPCPQNLCGNFPRPFTGRNRFGGKFPGTNPSPEMLTEGFHGGSAQDFGLCDAVIREAGTARRKTLVLDGTISFNYS